MNPDTYQSGNPSMRDLLLKYNLFCCYNQGNNLSSQNFLKKYFFFQMWYSVIAVLGALLFSIESGVLFWVIYALIVHGIAFTLCIVSKDALKERGLVMKIGGFYLQILNIFNFIACVILSIAFLAFFFFVWTASYKTALDVILGYFFGFFTFGETAFTIGQICQFGSYRRAVKEVTEGGNGQRRDEEQ